MNPAIYEVVKQKNAIIFDLFHTLTAPEVTAPNGQSTSAILGLDVSKWNEQLMEKSKERLKGFEKDPYKIIRNLAHAINPDISEDLIVKATNNRIKRFDDALINMPLKNQDAIKALKRIGKKVALLSNADVVEAAAWEKSPIASYFDVVIFSCNVGFVKPEVEIYHLCLERLRERPEACLFVGDGGSNEFIGARQVGLTTVMTTGIIENLWPHKIADIQKNADFVIKELSELTA